MAPHRRPRGLDRSEKGVMMALTELPEIKVGTECKVDASSREDGTFTRLLISYEIGIVKW